jgi:hypothetical protein
MKNIFISQGKQALDEQQGVIDSLKVEVINLRRQNYEL